ncbi:PHB depolymerase family esterase [Mobilicoccus caccae]|uniref:Esterase Ig-like N-terminal domain-containing protein n=1 Tax=Mobilicoccus caccae TaxID=1859295 RepID=A0ABQ6IM57_9MICO|nr:PHB depolymerase family esterase [Mobilicoccus caccae]GMA38511.1 hypothetical protein GCM10025883_05560 [Mobilicoccus caccae]
MKVRLFVSAVVSGLVVTGGVVPASASGGAQAPPAERPTTFLLDARVLDGGQQVVSVTLDLPEQMKVDPRSLTPSTFTVRAKGANPARGADTARFAGEYDLQRQVTGVRVNRAGDVVVDLAHGPKAQGASTFGWAPDAGRNVVLDLTYTITQAKPLKLRNGSSVTLKRFAQGSVVDREVDAFGAGMSSSGLKYRVYTPARKSGEGSKRPLVVWLHGGGEGGWSQSYHNDLPLIANRGALGFATREAQRTFGGAYVVAPQAWTRWLDDDTYDYTARLKSLIDEFARKHDVDTSRIYVAGASNGGYMASKLASAYPKAFAANVSICPVAVFTDQAAGTTRTVLTDAQLRRVRSTPTWIIYAKNDPVVDPVRNGRHMAEVIGNAVETVYPAVVRNGHEYDGHWTWIYAARNDPKTPQGTSLWTWMAQQQR